MTDFIYVIFVIITYQDRYRGGRPAEAKLGEDNDNVLTCPQRDDHAIRLDASYVCNGANQLFSARTD